MSEVETKAEEQKDAESGINSFHKHLDLLSMPPPRHRMFRVERQADGFVFMIDIPAPLGLPMKKLLTGRRILVVEDEMIILMFTEYMLADLGCAAVVSATTVDLALAFVGAQDFDAAMLDVNLNSIKSYPVADALAGRGVPFVFATADGGSGIDENYRDRPVLTKPYRYDELSGMLARLIPSAPHEIPCSIGLVA